MQVDFAKIRSLQERETASYFKQRADNEAKVAKIAEAIKKYPDIADSLGLDKNVAFTYEAMVPEAYKPVAEIDKPTLRIQTEALQTIVNKYNQIVLAEYERAVELQQQADKIVGIGG